MGFGDILDILEVLGGGGGYFAILEVWRCFSHFVGFGGILVIFWVLRVFCLVFGFWGYFGHLRGFGGYFAHFRDFGVIYVILWV